MSGYEGILVIDKPAGWTSHDVVKKTKNLLGGCKVGHTGTLDPFATGILILLVGNATKIAKYFEQEIKGYDAEVSFGSETDTYDVTGKVTSTGKPDYIDRLVLDREIHALIGEQYQVPPMYSALKVNGTRLYKLARKGQSVEIKPRKITIYSLDTDYVSFPVVRLSLTCSKGTYVRSIAHDLGKAVGCPAHLSALRRTRSGQYTINDAIDFLSVLESGDTSQLVKCLKPVTESISSI